VVHPSRFLKLGLLMMVVSLASCSALRDPLKPDPARMESWRDARFGMFIHWGPVSLKGTEIGWSRGQQVPVEEYDNLYKQFAAPKFDADRWASVAKAGGMKYLVLVTKHHDGFCMFDTRQTDFNVMNSPLHKDVVAELAQACRKQGLAFGTYHSVCDWHHPDFPLTSPGGKVKRPEPNLDRYNDYLKAQVKELITQYGPLVTLWFDVPQMFDQKRGEDLIKYVRKLQPTILINNRSGAGGDYDTPEQRVGTYQFDRPWETCMTIGDQWAWKPNDRVKSLKQCLGVLARCAGGDGNLLFNVGPTPEGEIEPEQIKRLEEMGAWLQQYGQAIYDTRGGPWIPSASVVSTRKDNVVYVLVLEWKGDSIVLPPLPRKIVRSSLLTGGTATVEQSDKCLTITVPPEARRDPITVVKLELNGSAMKLAVLPGTGPKATASNIYQKDEDFAAAAAVDDDPDSRWATDAGVSAAWLQLDYGRPVTFNGVRIREDYDRVQKFEVQVKVGKGWKTVYSGTTIGKDFEKKFESVSARVVRLNILEATEGPTIWEFELLGAPR
jgi:alpha-L-fucosidase